MLDNHRISIIMRSSS